MFTFCSRLSPLCIYQNINALKTITSRDDKKEFSRGEEEALEKRPLVPLILLGNKWTGYIGMF